MPMAAAASCTCKSARSSFARAWIARRGLSQGWLAQVLGLSQSVVSKRLRGVLPFSVPEVMMTATALDLSLAQLLGSKLSNEKDPHPVGEGPSIFGGGGRI